MAIQKTNQTLPASVIHRFAALNDQGDTATRDALIQALRAAHWTCQSIASGAGVSRERVRQIASGPAVPIPYMGEIPSPPTRPAKAPVTRVHPSPEAERELRRLKPLAARVRGNAPAFREEAERFTKLLADEVARGVSMYSLGLLLGIEPSGIRSRLVRYGYLDPQNATSRAYQPVKVQNRVDA